MANTEGKSYDLVVIGAGPAGIVGAVTAAALRRSVAVVDSHAELGGAGVNTGTVPSKTLRETALTLSGMRSRKLYGVDLSLRREATVSDFLHHERNVKAGLNAMLSGRLQASRADVYRGSGSFADAHTVLVQRAGTGEEIRLRAECVLIATGSSPIRPPLFPFGSRGVYDSDSILELDRLPRSLAVIGGGVIGSEYACTFAALGTQVHLIDSRDVLLPFLDREVSQALAAGMERIGVQFHWNERATACCAAEPDGVALTLSSGISLTTEAVLVAAGRKSNTGNLSLSLAGVTANERGLIHVDEHYRTVTPHIYAAGDVIGFPALASTSMQQARVALLHAFGQATDSDAFRPLPAGVYTIPEVSMIGETEESLQQKREEYIVGRGPYQANARGRIIGDADGFLKLLFRRRDMKLLGVHAIGEQATELVHIGMMALLAGGTAELFAEACFNMPTLGELYRFAALDAISRASTGRSLIEEPASLDLPHQAQYPIKSAAAETGKEHVSA
ncbi:MAG: Si-specific NAD(P)(+) transhydrogenase [Terriglobia bacterium]|nr:MAG: Si-specific NAD(P)(+) transhydrogenase [Terriglobia bacterium]